MARELLYVYTENLNDCFINQGINFSPNFEVEFDIDDGELALSHEPNNIFSTFWGENVQSINLIVGKNGSGKSTILDLLGSKKNNRNDLLSTSKSGKWFALYYLEEDYYVLEGIGIDIIRNLYGLPNKVRRDYAIVIQFKNGKFYFSDFIANFSKENHKLVYLYDGVSISEHWYDGKRFNEDNVNDSQLGYQRIYTATPFMYDLFSTLNNAIELDSAFNAKNVEVRITRRDSILDLEEDALEKLGLNLYSDSEKVLVFNPDSRIAILKNKQSTRWTNKERFIIEFLEESIFYILLRNKASVSSRLVKKVNMMDFPRNIDTFDSRVIYLNEILKTIYANKEVFYFDVANFGGYSKIIYLLKGIDEICYDDENNIRFKLLDVAGYNHILEFVKFYDSTEEFREVYPLKIEFSNFSSGELQFIKHFANLYKAIHLQGSQEIETIIILLDEPDQSFHPEWSRRYIANLVNLLNSVTVERDVKFQIIITTHSPFMVSDVPRQFITCIDVSGEKGGLRRVISKADFGLMSNFYDLMKNNFFMEYPIGEYAREIFKNLLADIYTLSGNQDQIEKVKSMISLIDDPLIKRKLLNSFAQKMEGIGLSDYEQLFKEKQRLEKQQKEIEKKLNDMGKGQKLD